MSLRSTLTVAATAATLAGTVAMAPAASAAPVVQNGCATMANGVQRCVTFARTPGARLFAKASITDPAGGQNFAVKVYDLKWQVWKGDHWGAFEVSNDYDGFFPDTDVARTDSVGICGEPQTRMRVRASFAWRGGDGVIHHRDLVTDGTARGMEC